MPCVFVALPSLPSIPPHTRTTNLNRSWGTLGFGALGSSCRSTMDAFLLSIGGGLLARQLRTTLYPPDACGASSHSFHTDVTPTLRVPSSPVTVAAWVAGGLAAHAFVIVVWRLVDLWRGTACFHVHKAPGARLELQSGWRTVVGHGHGLTVRGTPSARSLTHRAIEGMRARHSDSVAAVVVVNL